MSAEDLIMDTLIQGVINNSFMKTEGKLVSVVAGKPTISLPVDLTQLQTARFFAVNVMQEQKLTEDHNL